VDTPFSHPILALLRWILFGRWNHDEKLHNVVFQMLNMLARLDVRDFETGARLAVGTMLLSAGGSFGRCAGKSNQIT
jgi:hypothetical protein